ncbi:hypothetical protein KIP88_02820 [Bradyrhizobium sp. SRL28]|nr:hypothetical protein [Bradyrhizobium sp. SRL28]MBT1509424.1 hypothetical protein [Bradyrhizobium sp. SRL28]
MSIEDEADEIRERIEDLDILLETLQQTSETLAVFLRPPQPIKKETVQ